MPSDDFSLTTGLISWASYIHVPSTGMGLAKNLRHFGVQSYEHPMRD